MKMHRLLLAGLAVALTVTACARREPPPEPRPPVQPRPAPTVPRAPSVADYVSRAGSIDLFVIRSSELLLARSQDLQLRDYARAVIRDHNGTSGQLSFAGRRLNQLPSVTLRPEHEAMMRELLQTTDYNRVYRRQQVTVHDEAIALHSGFAARGSSPTLKPVATAALPIERRHLARLRAIR